MSRARIMRPQSQDQEPTTETPVVPASPGRHPGWRQRCEARGEPDPMAHDVAGKAVVLVPCGVGRRGHASLPMRGFDRSLRGQRSRDEVMTQVGGATTE